MKYYKIIDDSAIIGVCSSQDFRCFQNKHHIMLSCDEKLGQYVSLNEDLYRDDWLVPDDVALVTFTRAQIKEIDKEEYDILKEACATHDTIPVEEENEQDSSPAEETTFSDPIDELTLEFVIQKKIEAMSRACNRTIESGFDIILEDSAPHHFSMTTQDQINFILLSSMVESGENEIPYHADGELCVFYSAEDMGSIIAKATEFKTYQVTYFNSLKNYIESLDDLESISAIEYGTEIPEEFQSEVFKALTPSG